MGVNRYRQGKDNNTRKAGGVGTVKTLKLLNANDNVAFDYALAA